MEELITPILNLYELVQYSATSIAILMLVVSGVRYIMSGSDHIARDKAKQSAANVVVGLVIIWAAPFVIEYIY